MAKASRISAAAKYVTVACKYPAGIILRLYNMMDTQEPIPGGGMRTVPRAVQMGPDVPLNGYAVPFGAAPNVPIHAGCGLTHNVDADFFSKWLEQNRDSDLVKNGIVFASSNLDTVKKVAQEREKSRNGLEPIDPDRLPRGIQKADNKAA